MGYEISRCKKPRPAKVWYSKGNHRYVHQSNTSKDVTLQYGNCSPYWSEFAVACSRGNMNTWQWCKRAEESHMEFGHQTPGMKTNKEKWHCSLTQVVWNWGTERNIPEYNRGVFLIDLPHHPCVWIQPLLAKHRKESGEG